jgi:hypothetical protein
MALASTACVALAAWALAANLAHAQSAAPAQVAPDYSGTSGVIPWSAIMEKPLAAGMANAGSGNAGGGQGSSDANRGAGSASHEELTQSSLRESIREFNSGETGVKKPEGTGENPAVNPLRKPVTSAAAKAAHKSNHDQWAAMSLRDEMIADALPWAYGIAGLLAVGFAVKVWLNYMQAKAARHGVRRRAARKRSRRSSVSSDAAAGSGGSPQSQSFVSTLGGLSGQGGAANAGSSTSSSGSSGPSGSSGTSGTSSDGSGRRRHRSHRSQL